MKAKNLRDFQSGFTVRLRRRKDLNGGAATVQSFFLCALFFVLPFEKSIQHTRRGGG
jgi:hypothetical protein